MLLLGVMDTLPVSCLWLRKRHIWGKIKDGSSPLGKLSIVILALNPIPGLQLPALEL